MNCSHSRSSGLNAAGLQRESIEVVFKVRKNDLLLELLQRTAGVALQNVTSNLLLSRVRIDTISIGNQIWVFIHLIRLPEERLRKQAKSWIS